DGRHPRQPECLEILGRDDGGDVRMRQSLRGVDRDDAGVRVGTAQHRAVDHPRQADVVEVGALAADEALVLLALEAAEADRALGLRARKVLSDGHAQTPCLAAASCSAAHWIAATMFLYPVQRQIPPEMAVRISRSVGFGFSSRRARAVISIPGVQKPHWRAWSSWKPCCTGSSRPSTSSDSTVPISSPSAIAARPVHAVQQADAGAAVGGVAAPVGTGEAGRFADEMDQEVAGLDLAGHRLAVDRYRDAHAQTS